MFQANYLLVERKEWGLNLTPQWPGEEKPRSFSGAPDLSTGEGEVG